MPADSTARGGRTASGRQDRPKLCAPFAEQERPGGGPAARVFDRERVLRLYRRGATVREIARKLSIGLGTVARALKSRP